MGLVEHIHAGSSLVGGQGSSLHISHPVRLRPDSPTAARRPANLARVLSQASVRIYLPAWGAILVALLLAEIYPRVVRPEFSWWLNLHDEEPVIARDAWSGPRRRTAQLATLVFTVGTDPFPYSYRSTGYLPPSSGVCGSLVFFCFSWCQGQRKWQAHSAWSFS